MAFRVLIVIDLLNDFLNPKGALYCGDGAKKIIPVVRSLIDEFNASGEKVISCAMPTLRTIRNSSFLLPMR